MCDGRTRCWLSVCLFLFLAALPARAADTPEMGLFVALGLEAPPTESGLAAIPGAETRAHAFAVKLSREGARGAYLKGPHTTRAALRGHLRAARPFFDTGRGVFVLYLRAPLYELGGQGALGLRDGSLAQELETGSVHYPLSELFADVLAIPARRRVVILAPADGPPSALAGIGSLGAIDAPLGLELHRVDASEEGRLLAELALPSLATLPASGVTGRVFDAGFYGILPPERTKGSTRKLPGKVLRKHGECLDQARFSFVVDSDGLPFDVRLQPESVGVDCERSGLEAVAAERMGRWVFEPGKLDDRAVSTVVEGQSLTR